MSNFGQYNINAIFTNEQGDYASLNEAGTQGHKNVN